MCPHLLWSLPNPHTVIWSTCRTLWTLPQFSCKPTLAATLSTSCCSCTWCTGRFSAGRVRGRFPRTLRNIFSLWGFSSFPFRPVPYSLVCAPCAMCYFFVSVGGGWWSGLGGGGGLATVSPFFFLFLLSSPSWCGTVAFWCCRGVGAFLVALRLVWRGFQLLLNQLLKPGYPLANYVFQFSWRLVFSLVSRGVRHGEYS